MRRFGTRLIALCFACVVPAALANHSAHDGTPAMDKASQADTLRHDGRHDFDFLAGRWYAHSRRLVRPLDAGADQWEEFDSVHDGVLLPSGFGVADDYRIPARPDFIGLALQLYDPRTRQWQAYWYRLGMLTASLVGAFDDGVGIFEGPDTHEGRSIRTRYTWSRITSSSARWEQEFSADAGRTWETNWVMEYTRKDPASADCVRSASGTR